MKGRQRMQKPKHGDPVLENDVGGGAHFSFSDRGIHKRHTRYEASCWGSATLGMMPI